MSVLVGSRGEYRLICEARSVCYLDTHVLARPIKVGRLCFIAIEVINDDYRVATLKHRRDDIYVGLGADSFSLGVYEIENYIRSVIARLGWAEGIVIVISRELDRDTDVSVVIKPYPLAYLLIRKRRFDFYHSVVLVIGKRHNGEKSRKNRNTGYEHGKGYPFCSFSLHYSASQI